MEKNNMEPVLASFQIKKASQLFAALKNLSGLDSETDVRFPEIIEWREYGKDGMQKKHPVFVWHKGKTAGLAPSRTLMFVVNTEKGPELLPPKMIALETTYQAIFYRPAVVQMNINNEKRLAAIYSFDSFFLPCSELLNFEAVLEGDFLAYIEGVQQGMKLLQPDQQLFKGPNPKACSLERYGDCRGCLRTMLRGCETWGEAREIVESSTGLGTLYEDDRFVIRKTVPRAPYFYPIWVEEWLEGRTKEHLIGLIDELHEIADIFEVRISETQKAALLEVAKKITKSTATLGRIEDLPIDSEQVEE